tara:strand:+ start:2011 stop:2325 length:315 start_codon:yes stop_codon:yes gene_type:complete
MGKRYSQTEDDYIQNNYKRHTYFEISIVINRDPRSVRERALSLGLKKANRKDWTSDECLTFLSNIVLPDKELAQILGRNRRSVSAKRAWFRNKIQLANEAMRSA